MTAHISAAFDSGNIDLLSQQGNRFDLEIRRDHLSDFYQWFHFRLTGAKGEPVVLQHRQCRRIGLSVAAGPGLWRLRLGRPAELASLPDRPMPLAC
jgi:hypothetical protein